VSQSCNFIFKCGEKKQCSYYGFRDMMTMCKETGELCAWPYSDDEESGADDENDYEAPKDAEKPKPAYTPAHKPKYTPDPKPEYTPAPKPVYTPVPPMPEPWLPAPNSTEYPHGPDGKKKVAKGKTD
jgi:hypothetical protein